MVFTRVLPSDTEKVIASACAYISLCLPGPGLLQRTVSNYVLAP